MQQEISEDINTGAPEALKLAIEAIAKLTDEQRMELFRDYCLECGTPDPRCQCWNDE